MNGQIFSLALSYRALVSDSRRLGGFGRLVLGAKCRPRAGVVGAGPGMERTEKRRRLVLRLGYTGKSQHPSGQDTKSED